MTSRGAGPPTNLVVRRYAPLRPVWIVGVLATLACIGLYIVYELGRYDAGYDRQAAAQARVELKVRIEHLEKENSELRTRLATFDTVRAGQAREQSEIARTIGDLQAQVARQSQELAFYQRVLPQGTPGLAVRINELRIAPGSAMGLYTVHFTLLRTGKADRPVNGTLGVTVEGEGGAHLDLAALTGQPGREVPFGFRFYQNFDLALHLPATFHPEQLTLEVRGAHGDAAPVTQSFLWTVTR